MEVVGAEEEVAAARGFLAVAQRQPALLSIATLGQAVARRDFAALLLLLQDDVDDAGHRIGAVDGRCAAAHDLDAVDHGQRNAVEVGQPAQVGRSQAVVRHAAAVDQDQRRARAQAVQAGRRRGGERLLRLEAAIGRHVHRVVADHAGLVAQQLEHRLVAAGFDLRAADARQRGRRHHVDGGARNVRARHFDGRQFDGLADGFRFGRRRDDDGRGFDQERIGRDLHRTQPGVAQQHGERFIGGQTRLQAGRTALLRPRPARTSAARGSAWPALAARGRGFRRGMTKRTAGVGDCCECAGVVAQAHDNAPTMARVRRSVLAIRTMRASGNPHDTRARRSGAMDF